MSLLNTSVVFFSDVFAVIKLVARDVDNNKSERPEFTEIGIFALFVLGLGFSRDN